MEVGPVKEGFIFTQLPALTNETQTQCLIRLSLIRQVAATPGYPAELIHPESICCRVRPSPYGLGLFATRHLSLGELIFTERPLTITPTYLRTPELEHHVQGLAPDMRGQAILDEWERRFLRPLVSRLRLEDKEAFMDLANCHLADGSGPILGVIRTNGLDPGLVDPLTGDEYAAVCKTMSRINHSCCPSADWLFDLASFSFQLRATQDIKEGEEIFISYCDILNSVSVRREDLADWGFTCTCKSCS